MTQSLTVALPAGWRKIDAGPSEDAEIAQAVDEAFAGADRDSSAVQKHWMRQRLKSSLHPDGEVDAEVVSILYPEKATGGVPLPVSATILRLGLVSDDAEAAMRTVALLMSEDKNAALLETPAGIVVRTQQVRDVRQAFDQIVDEAPLTEAERTQVHETGAGLPTLRVRYVLPAAPGAHWHAIAFSAVLGSDEPELIDQYIKLFDAFANTIAPKAAL